jgi:ribosomal protein S6
MFNIGKMERNFTKKIEKVSYSTSSNSVNFITDDKLNPETVNNLLEQFKGLLDKEIAKVPKSSYAKPRFLITSPPDADKEIWVEYATSKGAVNNLKKLLKKEPALELSIQTCLEVDGEPYSHLTVDILNIN